MSRTRFVGGFGRSAHDDAVPDVVQELERELRRALALEPSPQFANKVRARIRQRASDAGRPTSRWAAAFGIVALTLGWGVYGRPAQELTVLPRARAAVDVQLGREAAVLPTPPPATGRPHAADGRRFVRAAAWLARPQAGTEPAVIVPRDNARGVTKLLALARSGGVDEESLRPAAAPTAAATLDLEPIVVPPISVLPLEILGAPDAGAR